jgi:hypothetical protein
MIEERSDTWARRLCAWLRSRGWDSRLLIHELRAFTGSEIYRHDPVQAMRTLRHKSIRTTEENYVRYGLDPEAIDVL